MESVPRGTKLGRGAFCKRVQLFHVEQSRNKMRVPPGTVVDPTKARDVLSDQDLNRPGFLFHVEHSRDRGSQEIPRDLFHVEQF